MKIRYTRLIKKLVTPTSSVGILAYPEDDIPTKFKLPIRDGLVNADIPTLETYNQAFLDCQVDMREVRGNTLSYRMDQLWKMVSDGFTEELETNVVMLHGEQRGNYIKLLDQLYDECGNYVRYGNVMDYFSYKVTEIVNYREQNDPFACEVELRSNQEKFLITHNARRYIQLLEYMLPAWLERPGLPSTDEPPVAVIALFLSYLMNAKIEEWDFSEQHVEKMMKKYNFTKSIKNVRNTLYNKSQSHRKQTNILAAIEILKSRSEFASALKLAENDLLLNQ